MTQEVRNLFLLAHQFGEEDCRSSHPFCFRAGKHDMYRCASLALFVLFVVSVVPCRVVRVSRRARTVFRFVSRSPQQAGTRPFTHACRVAAGDLEACKDCWAILHREVAAYARFRVLIFFLVFTRTGVCIYVALY